MDMHDQPTESWKAEARVGGKPTVPLTGQASGASYRRGLSRRALLGGALGVAAVGAAAAAAGVVYEQKQSQGSGPVASNQQIGHLLRRAGFGATPEELKSYSALGYTGAVDRLLNYQQVSDNAMEQRLQSLNLDINNNPAQQQRWLLLRMAWTQRPLLEKMTLFWQGVFTSSFRKVGGKGAYGRMIVQNNFLREHAFDTYDNLLLGITADPAMLVYLDLTRSHKAMPNENYARELMELFSLGVGNYTQQDVFQGAAALTGWHVIGNTTQSRFVERDHNTEIKTYLGQTGNFDYKDVVRILADNPATPRFICGRMFSFFVHENPSADDLKPLIDSYVSSKHNMGAVMRTLLLSPQFSSAQAYRSRVKSPSEFVVGAYRALNAQTDGTGLETITTAIGQPLFDPPNVAGWPGDRISSAWLNSGTWMLRLNYLDLLLVGNRNTRNYYKPFDFQGVIDSQHIDTPEHFVDYFSSYLLDGNVSSDRHMQFIDYFNTPNTTALLPSTQKITLANGKIYPLSRVRGTLYLMLGSPEYQLN
jgi:Protein of unknown function (DUF1800)